MKFRNKHNNNKENFWLSATDLMAGILITVPFDVGAFSFAP